MFKVFFKPTIKPALTPFKYIFKAVDNIVDNFHLCLYVPLNPLQNVHLTLLSP